MNASGVRALVALRTLRGLGDVRRRALLARHRTPRAALRAALAAAPLDRVALEDHVDRVLDATAAIGARIIGLRDTGYPRALRRLRDAPTVLWARGDVGLLHTHAVAIVGTRRNTEYGADVAKLLATGLVRAGVTVVSGLAHGIDRYAHEATLEAGGSTIAIVGSGIDVVYPHTHEKLQERIARDGLLLSEFLPGEAAMRHHFPRRNRLIAALSLGVVVVEAPEKSGALNTAHHALDLNRDVFAVPGPIGRDTSAGTNALIRDGAQLVMDAADILEPLHLVPTEATGEAQPVRSVPNLPDADPATTAVLDALDLEPRHLDELTERSGLAAARVSAILLNLEMLGIARQVPGLRFARPLVAKG